MPAPMMEKKIKSALPLYLAAAAFLLLSFLLPIYQLGGFLIACGLALVVFAMAEKKIPPRIELVPIPSVAFATGDAGLNATLEKARTDLETLNQLNDKIPDPQLSAQIGRMQAAGEEILQQVARDPSKARGIRKFAAYYLPTAIRILTNYANLAASGAKGTHAAALENDVRKNAAIVADAFEKQLDALFAGAALDVSADLTVLETMAKSDGLAAEDFTVKPADSTPTLTL